MGDECIYLMMMLFFNICFMLVKDFELHFMYENTMQINYY